MDLIYIQAAIDAVEESRRSNHHQDGKEACAHEFEHRHFLKILRELPSAESKVVRCKDCVYSSYEPHKDQADVYVYNYSHWRRSEGGLFPDDFCSKGEPMSDLIDRRAAINALHEWELLYDWDQACRENRERVYAPSDAIEALPPAGPGSEKWKIGHWIVRNEYSMYPVLCSECGGWQSSRSKFCPDCGADMRGGTT